MSVRVCDRDREPLVWTFEFPGSEWYCVICEGHEDLFGARVDPSPALLARLDELTERYERARAERRGVPYVAPNRAGDVGGPVCDGCGTRPVPGLALVGGKPRAWYSRTVDGVTSYACSRGCIPEREAVMPW